MNNRNYQSRPVLLISYFSGINGCCPAEWVDDKLDSLGKLQRKVVLVSGVSSRREQAPHVVHYRVPSLSFADWKTERAELRSSRLSNPRSLYMILPLVLTVGVLLDIVQKYLTKGVGGGKWSWLVPASICSVFACLRHRTGVVFTSGGPASAHLAGVAVAKICLRKLVCELQDPLSGKEIGRNSRSARLLRVVEGVVVRHSDRVVYVTEQAAQEAKNCFGSDKTVCIYPGAPRFPEVEAGDHALNQIPFRLVHLGTLYSTRNMNTLIAAIELLISNKRLNPEDIEIVNLGEIYGENRAHHLSRSFVKQYPIKPRREAVKAAKTYNASLLIQHVDDRSALTIPYKTYDYLNIGNPILALTNNEELNIIMKKFGHYYVDVNNVEEISNVLMKLIENRDKKNINNIDSGFDAVSQCDKLVSF